MVMDNIQAYFEDKFSLHGAQPQGLDYNSEYAQHQRFRQLIKLVDHDEMFSLSDLGCGYGSLLPYMKEQGLHYNAYVGVDLVPDMIAAAKAAFAEDLTAKFYTGDRLTDKTDYVIACGIFNMRLDNTDEYWLKFIYQTLAMMDEYSTHGFAFNMLTSYSDEDRKRPDLYYADPCAMFDYCKRTFSRNIALLHDYDLYDFTILVRKAAA